MSIISEALKKAQEKRTGSKKLQVPQYEKVFYGPRLGTTDAFPIRPSTVKKDITGRRTNRSPLTSILHALVMFLIVSISGASVLGARLASLSFHSMSPTDMSLGGTPLYDTPPGIQTTPDDIAIPAEQPVSTVDPMTVDLALPDVHHTLPNLSGIMYTPQNPRAVIDGVLMSEGETVGGARISKIFPERVVFTYGDHPSLSFEYEVRLR